MKKAAKTTTRKKPVIKRKNARDGKPKVAQGKRPVRKASKRLPQPAPRDVGPVDLVQEAFGDITSLAEEMRTWADNMEEKFGATQKFQDVEAAADALENLDEPDVTITALNDHKLSWQDPRPRLRGYSRATRAMHACDMLRAVEDKMRELEDELPPDDPQHDAATALAEECENLISELEGIDFPGMY